jgi:pyridoxal phosphate enzyme (YggS family)
MADITQNIKLLNSGLPSGVRLVAVSKTMPVTDILQAYDAGQRCFGENRVQELLNKKSLLPSDIEWHLIGHLQSNKVKSVVPFISMIHSVDSYKLLAAINNEASKAGRRIDCLLQLHIAMEETKSGFSLNEIEEMAENHNLKALKNVRVCGMMGMATFTSDEEQIGKEFAFLRSCFDRISKKYFTDNPHFREISMGMSEDYKIAVREGSTLVRIGSLIFGKR